MIKKININPREKILIVYVVLAMVTLAVFWQVSQYDFIGLDDFQCIVNNHPIQSGITLNGVRWAFGTTTLRLWNPLIWLSLMFDYQLFGLNAGGYHMTNLILHILSTLLLFWIFNRVTGAVWQSAFVAAFFALHPLHVESVAWVSERKDVLSAFFWMLTLCLYVYYTEKPNIIRYLLVLFSFACALMSKSMVVTLPVIMILIDYWPLGRFQSKKGSLLLWQLYEKAPFFVLSAILSIITFYAMYDPTIKDYFPLGSRFANASVSFVAYLGKTFWPHDMAIFYPFVKQLPIWQILGAVLLILFISVAVFAMMKRMPYLFVGWLWYAITLLPAIGIIQNGYHAMADRYTYLPSIGIAIMLAWGIPNLFARKDIRNKILIPAEMVFLSILAILAWQQSGYWKNSFYLFNHAVLVTKDNYLAHNSLGVAFTYAGKYEEAIEHCNKAIRIKPDYANAYVGRAFIYYNTGQYEQALRDLNVAKDLQPDYVDVYLNKGITYNKLRQFHMAIENYNKAIQIQPDRIDFYNGRGYAYLNVNKYQNAIEDFNTAIHLKPDFNESYQYRGYAYLLQGNKELGCLDAKRACVLGDCKLLELSIRKGNCR